MYIAFRWLLGLTLAAWLTVCCLDFVNKTNKSLGPCNNSHVGIDIFKNKFPKTPRINKHLKHRAAWLSYQQTEANLLHYIMFIAGAFIMALHNKRNDLIIFTKQNVYKMCIKIHFTLNYVKVIGNYFKISAVKISVVSCKVLIKIWELIEPSTKWAKNYVRVMFYVVSNILINTGLKIKMFMCLFDTDKSKSNKGTQDDFALLKKLDESEELKFNLEQVLLASMQENRNLRKQLLLESMTKTRLLKQIDEMKITLKEHRTQLSSVQNVYLMTCQDNIFLKSRIKQLEKQKQDTAKKFTCLVYKIYQTKNVKLMDYCTQIINSIEDNILSINVKHEVNNVLRKSTSYSGNMQQSNDVTLAEFINKASTTPKLKGHPGEFAKPTKDYLLEKIYECDYDVEYDNGALIEQIRESSVYSENDICLRYTSSRTIVTQMKSQDSDNDLQVHDIISVNQRFLSNSPIFLKFLENNIHTGLITPCPPLLYK